MNEAYQQGFDNGIMDARLGLECLLCRDGQHQTHNKAWQEQYARGYRAAQGLRDKLAKITREESWLEN